MCINSNNMKISLFILYTFFITYVTHLAITKQYRNTDEELESTLLSRLKTILGVDSEEILMLVLTLKKP